MEIFKNKFLVKLITTICLFLTLLNFGSVSKVYASDDEIWGSVILKPIIGLFTGIGDSIMEILHTSIQEQRQSIIKLDGSEESKNAWSLFGAIAIGSLAAAAFIAACVVTGGAIAAAAAAAGVAVTFTVGVRNNTNRSSCWSSSWSKYI